MIIDIELIEWVIEIAKRSTSDRRALNAIEDISIHKEYAEPGYTDPETAIICANWNDISYYDAVSRQSIVIDQTMGRLAKIFEDWECEIEWGDEWAECTECSRLVRLHADSWHWTPYYICNDYGVVCADCLDAEEYLESIEDSEVLNQLFDPNDHNYTLVYDSFEHGFYHGQNADPNKIAELMREANFSRFIFSLESSGQFDVKFSLWIHDEEAKRCDGEGIILAKRIIEQGNTDGPSVAGAIKRSLEEASRKMDDIRSSGNTDILVANISMDGADVRTISAQEFIDGKLDK